MGDRASTANLSRRDSMSSMTERSFRPTSPVRTSPMPRVRDGVPPLPALPRDAGTFPAKTARKSNSIDFTSVARVSSPVTRHPEGRVSSSERSIKASSLITGTGGRPVKPALQVEVSPQRSINFSYPMSPANSPPASPLYSESSEIHDTSRVGSPVPNAAKSGNTNQIPALRKKNSSEISKAGKVDKTDLLAPARTSVTNNSVKQRPKSAAAAAAVFASNPKAQAVQKSQVNQDPRLMSRSSSPMLWRKPSVVEEVDEDDDLAITRAAAQRNAGALSATKQVARPQSSTGATFKARQEALNNRPSSALAGRTRNSADISARSMRPQSLSPARSARFSNVQLIAADGVKHEPLPRSMSPAKSALKHSPSSSLATNSPVASHFGVLNAQDNLSDISSENGQYNGLKKKKSAKVSFDKDAVKAAEEDSSTALPKSPHPLKTQNSLRSRSEAQDDLEEIKKPSPVLPSFGSMRDRRVAENGTSIHAPTFGSVRERRALDYEPESGERSADTVSSSISDSLSTLVEPVGVSSDQAVGAALMQDLLTKGKGPNEVPHISPQNPLPPEVTSVEGSGEVSDSDDDQVAENKTTEAEPISVDSNAVEKKITPASENLLGRIPTIELQPATPRVMDDANRMSTAQEEVTAKRKSETTGAGTKSADKTPTPDVNNANKDDIAKDSGNESDSHYSDAAEDMYDHQDDTYVSLDAMVEKTVPKSESVKERKVLQNGARRNSEQADVIKDKRTSLDLANSKVKSEPKRKSAPAHHIHWGSNQSIPTVSSIAKPPNRTSVKSKDGSDFGSVVGTDDDEPRTIVLKSALKTSTKKKNNYVVKPREHPSTQDAQIARTMRPSSQSSVISFRPKKPKLLRSFSSDSDSDVSKSSFERARTSTSFADGKYSMRRSMRASSPAFSDRPASVASGGRRSSFTKNMRLQSPERPASSQATRTTLRGPGAAAPSFRKQTGSPIPSGGGFGRKSKATRAFGGKLSSRFPDSSDEDEAPQRRAMFRSRFDDSDGDDDDLPVQPKLAPVRRIPRQADIPEGDSTDLPDTEDEDTVPPMRNIASRSAKTYSLSAVSNGSPISHRNQGSVLSTGSLRPSSAGSNRGATPSGSSLVNGIPPAKQRRHHSLSAPFGRHKGSSSLALPPALQQQQQQQKARKGSASGASFTTSLLTPPQAASPILSGSPSTTRSTTSTSRLRLHRPSFLRKKNSVLAPIVPPLPPPAAWPLPDTAPPTGRPITYSASGFAVAPVRKKGAGAFERPSTSDGVVMRSPPPPLPASVKASGFSSASVTAGTAVEEGTAAESGLQQSSRSQLGRRTSTTMTAGSVHGTVLSTRTGKKKKFPRLRRAFGLVD